MHLVADEHYGQVEASLNDRGMGHYGESHEAGRALIADGMEVKKLDEIPMSAMWVQSCRVKSGTVWRCQRGRSGESGVGGSYLHGQNLVRAAELDDGCGCGLGLVSGNTEADRRQRTGGGYQSVCDSLLRPSASG